MPQSKRTLQQTVLIFLLFGLIGLTAFCLGFFPIRDGGDQWWHLKTGKYLLETKFDFPEEDVFSWTSKGHPWANHEWLADTLMYLGYRTFDLKGLIALKALILTGVFLLVGGLIYRRTRSIPWAAAGALLAAWASQYSVHLRPPVLTYLFLAIDLHFLLNLQENKKVVLTQILSFPFMVLWINLHGGAIIGIVIAGIYFASPLFQLFLIRIFPNSVKDRENLFLQVKRLGVNLGIVTLASFGNPFTYHIHLLTLKVMRDKELVRFISELQMPDLHHTTGYLILLILFFALGMVAVRKVRLPDAILALFFLHQSLNHVRHLPLFAIAVTPILFELIAEWHKGLLKDAHIGIYQKLVKGIQIGLIVIVCLGSINLIQYRWKYFIQPLLTGPGYDRYGIPVDVVHFIQYVDKESPRFEGKMYNPINFSGYLIWSLSPESHQTFTDSRFDIFGSEVMLDCLSIEAANTLSPEEYLLPPRQQQELVESINQGRLNPYWKRALDRYEINFMIIGRDSRLHLVLNTARDQGWIKVYEDYGYALYVRDSEENQPLIEKAISLSRQNRG